MMQEYFRDLIAAGVEVAIIAEPHQVLIDCRGRDANVRDEYLVDLPREPDLTHLWLEGCNVSDVSVLPLVANRRLEVLDLGATHVSAAVLLLIPSWVNLAWLGLSGMYGINAGIEHLLDHPTLEAVDLSFTDITPANLVRLLVNTKIEGVDVSGTGIEASDVMHLDNIDAEPYRTVAIRFSDSERAAIVMGFKQLYQADAQGKRRRTKK